MTDKTLFVVKKREFDHISKQLYRDLKENLGITKLEDLTSVNRYDIRGLSDEAYEEAINLIFSEVQVDVVYKNSVPSDMGTRCFGVRYLPAQYDQRADSAVACIKLLTNDSDAIVVSSRAIFLKGDISQQDFEKIKSYCINPVDSCEIQIDSKPIFGMSENQPEMPKIIDNFIDMDSNQLQEYISNNGMAMSVEDLAFCQDYFKNVEKRNPVVTEIKVIDTYWSDHCRHTTFATKLKSIKIEDGILSDRIKKSLEGYLSSREFVYAENEKNRDTCLMDMAVIGMKELKKRGLLEDLDQSEEINACGIHINVDIDGEEEPWILMFKNETHNHPTEIEPFGGAATCIGGAIRDPLSGRSYVFGAMRVSGSGDPRQSIKDTLKGKLPQRKITKGALDGYSSYGNQIGLTTTKVKEFYHPGFVAKRLECGAVLGAVPLKNVRREVPEKGDIVVLVGGRTGKDGIGGATGSSKNHDEKSLETGGSEVQKGNAVTERKIQRFMRKYEVSSLIKRCNDFGAGGVAVAIGELCDGLDINLNAVPLKYAGLDATEITISESQERMAMVIEAENLDKFLELAYEENLEATKVADVTDLNRLRIYYNNQIVVDLSRDFLNTNGVTQETMVEINSPKHEYDLYNYEEKSLEEMFRDTMTDINHCSSRGMTEQFDSSIGSNTVLNPLGGKYQATENDAMVMKIPLEKGNTDTAAFMSYGYNPYLMEYSPYLGSQYAVIESLSRLVACGADYKKARLSFQEYFEKLGKDSSRWGKPVSALLGALEAQKQFGVAAIGGKDSMSGTFNDLDVPPTLISFAVASGKASHAVSQDIKVEKGGKLFLLLHQPDKDGYPDYDEIKSNFAYVNKLIKESKVHAAMSVNSGGLIKTLSNMCYGNRAGIDLVDYLDKKLLKQELYGSFVLQVTDIDYNYDGLELFELGDINSDFVIRMKDEVISLQQIEQEDNAVLEDIFPTRHKVSTELKEKGISDSIFYKPIVSKSVALVSGKPKVFLPVFPGTNCEFDMAKKFTEAGAEVDMFVFKNTRPNDIEESIAEMSKRIKESQIIGLSGGFSLGDEPDGSAKFITAVFRNQRVKEAVEIFLSQKDGLMLGICNGFQALIKLGLVPYGEIVKPHESNPTLTFNTIGRYTSKYSNTKVVSNLSPWMSRAVCGEVYSIPVAHGEGRLVIEHDEYLRLVENGQISTIYTDFNGKPTYDISNNPNGSYYAIEGICSPDGRIFGKMGHSERIGENIAKNIPGLKDQRLFQSGVDYFK